MIYADLYVGFLEIFVCLYQQKSQDHEMQVPISKYTALQICVFHSPCTHGFKPEFSPETAKTTYIPRYLFVHFNLCSTLCNAMWLLFYRTLQ